MLTGARCEKCNHALPLKGELRDFRLPPRAVACPGCGNACETILPYRVGWMEGLLWKVYGILAVPLVVAVALAGDWPGWARIALLVAGPLLGALGAFLLSRLTAFPLTLLVDRLRKKS